MTILSHDLVRPTQLFTQTASALERRPGKCKLICTCVCRITMYSPTDQPLVTPHQSPTRPAPATRGHPSSVRSQDHDRDRVYIWLM